MRGIITFTTDFGLADPFVAVMKGQALGRNRDLQLVDITHDITPYQPAEAGYWLERAASYFPEGTVHVGIVDPGVGSSRALAAVACDAQIFLAPDNGLLSGIVARPGAVARRVTGTTLAGFGAIAKGGTFHGRDLLAPLAAELASGNLAFGELGGIFKPVVIPGPPPATWVGERLQGSIVTIDRFGNLFSNIDAGLLDCSRNWSVRIREFELPCVDTYGDALPGELVALVNSWGVIELAEVEGNAARRLGAARGEALNLRYLPGG